MQNESPRQTVSGAVLLFIAFLFVLYGAYDLLGRIFSVGAVAIIPATETYAEGTIGSAYVPPLPVAPIVPLQLTIPRIGVTATVEHVGKKVDGKMANPSTFSTVAWYKEGARPGAGGNAVIAGHLNNAIGLSGVFEKLNTLALGDIIKVKDEHGKELTFIVREMTVYETDQAPTEQIFATAGPARLVLITCDGAWDQGKRSYDKRLIVFADLI